MRESKGAYVAANGLPLADWLMTRLDLLAALASKISPLANWALGNRQMRWLMEKTLGDRPGPEAAAGVVAEFPAPGGPPPLDPPSRRSAAKSALLRRHLRQLSRSRSWARPWSP